jgi:2-oxoglutarate ferredoxin oxidoreductase subunit gamma
MANMVALGAYVQATGVLPIKRVQDSLESVISSHYSHMIPKNATAIQAGADYVTEHGSL